MNGIYAPERIETVVIGGGQTGLSVGHHLARRGRQFVILDAHERIGDAWRKRWDSLRLFTPAEFDGLDGMPFPGDRNAFPRKDEMADYLESYATRFALPVRTGVRVTRVSRVGDRYLVEAEGLRIEADHVVVAMGSYQHPRVPEFAGELDGSIVQMHSSDYRNLEQLRPGGVLIVGAGNSGAEIAIETVRGGHPTWVAGRDVGAVPFQLDSTIARLVLRRLLFRVLFHRVLTLSTPVGRKAQAKAVHDSTPLIRTKPNDLARAGVERVGRVAGVQDGRPVLADGRVMDATNVIWCTGYHPGFSWIDLPIWADEGHPRHDRGVVQGEPGFYFVGLHWLYAMSSPMVHGVGRDADYVTARIEERGKSASPAPSYARQARAHAAA